MVKSELREEVEEKVRAKANLELEQELELEQKIKLEQRERERKRAFANFARPLIRQLVSLGGLRCFIVFGLFGDGAHCMIELEASE